MASKGEQTLEVDFYKLSAQEVQAEHEAEQWIIY